MTINYKKQHALGLAGLALLRNWLTGKEQVIAPILDEINDISKTQNNFISGVKTTEFNIRDGYKVWADSYDKNNNLLVGIEEPVVKSILKRFPVNGKALDAACGTGRYSIELSSLGYSVTGVDISPEMLSVARKRNKNIDFVEGSLDSLPFKDNLFDLVVCGLGMNQIKDVSTPIKELSRVLKPGGIMIISAIHPLLIILGAHAEFPNKNGDLGFIESTPHWHSEFIKKFNDKGLKILECNEPKMELKYLKTAAASFNLRKETVFQALDGLPIAVIWLLKKS